MRRVTFENTTTTGKIANTILAWESWGDLVEIIKEEYRISDVCIGELLAKTYISGMTLEDQVTLYAKLMKDMEEDDILRINEEEKTYKVLAEERISYYGAENTLQGMKIKYKGSEHNIYSLKIEKRRTGEIIEFSFNDMDHYDITDDGVRTILLDDICAERWSDSLDKMTETSRPLDKEDFAEEEYEWNLILKSHENNEEETKIEIVGAELLFAKQMKIILGTDKIIEMNRVLK